MKRIGLVGGFSWISTIDYYRYVNELVNDRLGGLHYADCVLFSISYHEIVSRGQRQDFDGIARLITDAAQKLEGAGAQCIVLCANTMHNMADSIQAGINVPIIHIAEAVSKAIAAKQMKQVALLGTKFTMEMDFYHKKLAAQGISALIPEERDRLFMHSTIHEELGKGVFLPKTKHRYAAIIEQLAKAGAEGAILGCTEIPMLIKQEDVSIPVFDTTFIHAQAAVEFAMGEN